MIISRLNMDHGRVVVDGGGTKRRVRDAKARPLGGCHACCAARTPPTTAPAAAAEANEIAVVGVGFVVVVELLVVVAVLVAISNCRATKVRVPNNRDAIDAVLAI